MAHEQFLEPAVLLLEIIGAFARHRLFSSIRMAAQEMQDLKVIFVTLTKHPWRIVERPSFAFLVFGQHLILSRLLRWFGPPGRFEATALWLGRAGFKQVFGPLFIFGSLGELCAASVLRLLQVIALPFFMLYLGTSLLVCSQELRLTIRSDRGLEGPRDGRPSRQQLMRLEQAEALLASLSAAEHVFPGACVICYEEEFAVSGAADDGQSPVVLPCGHQFHRECILAWFAQGSPLHAERCPMRCPLSAAAAVRQAVFH